MLDKGLVQIYTGDGKGKTTAAVGLALRAAGHGHTVLIYQFLKPASLKLGERLALEGTHLPITVSALDAEWDLAKSPDDAADVAAAKAAISRALKELTGAAERCAYDVIVLDEIVYCLSEGLAAFEDVEQLIAGKHKQCELVLTGRGADERIAALADLVTEMTACKHPYERQIGAREGIDF